MTAVLVLLIAIVLFSVTSKTTFAQSNSTITLMPSQAPAGSTIIVSGSGFPDGTPVTVKFNGIVVQSQAQGHGFQNLLDTSFTVPHLQDGSYTVTASDATGQYSASTTFTIGVTVATSGPTTSSSAASPSSTSPTSSSSSNTGVTPTYTPFVYPTLQPQNSGFSPLIIGLIVVVVAVAIGVPVTFMLKNRSPKRDLLLDKELSPYRADPYSQSNRPTPPPTSPYNPPTPRSSQSSTRYNQPSTRYSQTTAYSRYSAKPAVTDNYSSSPNNVQQSTSGRICPHCKRTVTGDYSVCPYCYKRMK